MFLSCASSASRLKRSRNSAGTLKFRSTSALVAVCPRWSDPETASRSFILGSKNGAGVDG